MAREVISVQQREKRMSLWEAGQKDAKQLFKEYIATQTRAMKMKHAWKVTKKT
jgi:hypothetical protein